MRRIIALLITILMVISIGVSYSVASTSYIIGDVDGDGKALAKDMNLMKRAFSGIYTIDDIRTADLNGDGIFGIVDINLFIRYLAGTYEIVQPEEESNSVSFENYTVVYPSNCNAYEMYAAELLCEYVEEKYNVEFSLTTDESSETQFEILIGNTNREESNIDVDLDSLQYIFKIENDKIVINGNDFMVAGGVGDLTYDCTDENGIIISNIPTEGTAHTYTARPAKNYILMIGDGMGFNQVAFAERWLSRSSMASYAYEGFIAEKFPNQGEEITYCLYPADPGYSVYYKRTTDSAASGTALATGWKTTFQTVGQNPFGIKYTNIIEASSGIGMSTAVMSTEGSTGATPAAFTAHTDSRSNKEEIISQQEQLLKDGTLTALVCGVGDNLLSSVKETLDLLDDNDNGYYVMIEEAYIDKACHYLGETYTRDDLALFVYRFNTAIQYCATYALARPDTVVVVTADHETAGITELGVATVVGQYHSNVNVPIYAIGYGTEVFNGTETQNNEVGIFFANSMGIESFGGSFVIDDSVFIGYKGYVE